MAPQPPSDPLVTFHPELFAGTVALVTGGGTGIGRATVLATTAVAQTEASTGKSSASTPSTSISTPSNRVKARS